MSSKPESQFIAKVHKRTKQWGTYHEKNHNVYRGGTPDVFYSGCKNDLWVEYKYLTSLPVREDTPVKIDLSPLQDRWLLNRYREGRNVSVIVGCPEGGVILKDLEWRDCWLADAFKKRVVTLNDVATFIFQFCGEGNYDL